MEMDVAKAARSMELPLWQQRDSGCPCRVTGWRRCGLRVPLRGATSLRKGLVPPRGPGAHGWQRSELPAGTGGILGLSARCPRSLRAPCPARAAPRSVLRSLRCSAPLPPLPARSWGAEQPGESNPWPQGLCRALSLPRSQRPGSSHSPRGVGSASWDGAEHPLWTSSWARHGKPAACREFLCLLWWKFQPSWYGDNLLSMTQLLPRQCLLWG